jgi:hypothetical protein
LIYPDPDLNEMVNVDFQLTGLNLDQVFNPRSVGMQAMRPVACTINILQLSYDDRHECLYNKCALALALALSLALVSVVNYDHK